MERGRRRGPAWPGGCCWSQSKGRCFEEEWEYAGFLFLKRVAQVVAEFTGRTATFPGLLFPARVRNNASPCSVDQFSQELPSSSPQDPFNGAGERSRDSSKTAAA